MTCHCGRVALRHVGKKGFCKLHLYMASQALFVGHPGKPIPRDEVLPSSEDGLRRHRLSRPRDQPRHRI